MRPRPAFIPPDAPAPILDLTTADGIKRAIPIMAGYVERMAMTFTEALDLLMRAYVCYVWNGHRMRTIMRVEDRIITLLANAIEVAIKVAEDIHQWEELNEIEREIADDGLGDNPAVA